MTLDEDDRGPVDVSPAHAIDGGLPAPVSSPAGLEAGTGDGTRRHAPAPSPRAASPRPADRVVVMGVSGCGKSLIGGMLADWLRLPFEDGDDLHPQSNIDKMAGGVPLTDADRAPWLAAVGRALAATAKVVACSALKRDYRDRIRAQAGAVVLVHLAGDRSILLDRVSDRPGHFMPADLLDSQLETLEPPGRDEDAIIVDIDQTPDEILAAIRATGRFGAG